MRASTAGTHTTILFFPLPLLRASRVREGELRISGRRVRSVEILEIFALELDVFQWGESGESGETEEGDNGVHEGMRCGGGVRVAMGVDGESVG
jgi:hypothetical protein